MSYYPLIKNVMDLNIIIIQMDVRFLMRNLEDVLIDVIIWLNIGSMQIKYFPEIKCCIQAVRSLKRNYCSNNQCYKSTNYCILFLPAFNKSCLKYYFWRVSYRVFLEASYDRM